MATELIGVGGAAPELRQAVKKGRNMAKARQGRTPMKTTFPPAVTKPGSGAKVKSGKATTTFGAIKGKK